MIEIKISQGAKPGFGAILPAKKNTEEISKFREIEAHTEIHSPAHHSAFNNSQELIRFIDELRELSSGKPIGIKLCLGQQKEFEKMIKVFAEMQSYPDFIVIDGAEGGSGAANMDSLHWGGTPLQEALHFVNKTLVAFHLRQHIKILASGKIISAFDIYKTLALGADACYGARGMMFALGCVQSLKCNLNTCPTGITTMDPGRIDSLSVVDKKVKVANYHRNTIEGFKELLKSMGIENRRGIDKKYIVRRINENETKTYHEIYSNGLNGRKIKRNE
jgi:glutamate synthase domain-containing protein 2